MQSVVKMASCVVDLHCFVDDKSEFIVKELAVLDYNFLGVRHWIFKPPKYTFDLKSKTNRTNQWLTSRYHGIDWYEGEVEYDLLSTVLRNNLQKYAIVYVKGQRKMHFLRRFIQNAVIDLEERDCPKIGSLKPPVIVCELGGCHCLVHDQNPEMCTLYRVYSLAAWLRARI